MKPKAAADQAARTEALTPGKSFIVQAPAGSGKTELLIQRFLVLLALVEHPEEIIAITFTRKAAAEMQGRIVGALRRAATDPEPAAEHERVTWRLARSALERDKACDWQLLDNPGRLRVQTVDSLCNYLTRQMPLLSRLGGEPEILDDASQLQGEAATATLDMLEQDGDWSDPIAALLTHLDNDLPRARDLLARMLVRRDQWLRHVAGGVNRSDLEAGFRRLIGSTLTILRAAIADDVHAELIALLDYAAENLERENRESPIRLCAGLEQLPGVHADDLPLWQGIAEFLLTGQGTWRKQADARQGFPAAGTGAGREQRAAMKDRFKALLSMLNENDGLQKYLLEVQYLPADGFSDAEWQIAEALSKLLTLADAQLRVLFGQEHCTDYIGVALAAIDALQTDDAPTDLTLHLDYRIRHLLIDEFQDISINQYELLHRLTDGWSGDDGHSLFLVGDPMQSIYRFREAEVGKFLDTWEQRRLGQVPLEQLKIEVNFRSGAGIVEWVNESFSLVLPATADVGRGAVPYAPARAHHPAGPAPAVCIHPFFDGDHGREADTVLRLIEEAQQQRPQGTIAVLVRTRTHLTGIVPRLRARGLRFRAVEIDALGGRPVIQDLLALVRALHHRADRIAWLAVLRGPCCGLSLAALHQLAGGNGDVSVWDCMNDPERIGKLDKASQRCLIRVRDVFSAAIANQGRLTLRRWVEGVWLALGGAAVLADATDLDNARTFLRLLDKHDAGGVVEDIGRLTREVGKLFAAPDVRAEPGLQIMTMHKAKGLEFDTVILPGLGRRPRGDDKELLLWDERASEHGGQDLLLAPIQETGGDESQLYKCLRYFEKERRRYEEGRLLYVAATRAREQLHLLGSVNLKDGEDLRAPWSGSLLSHLWPVVEPEFQRALENAGARAQSSTDAPVAAAALQRLPADWAPPPAPGDAAWTMRVPDGPGRDEAPEFEWASETIRHVGTVVHRRLQQMAQEGAAGWSAEKLRSMRGAHESALRQLGVVQEELGWAVEQVELALGNVLDDEKARWILSAEHRDAQSEYRLTGMHDGRLVNVVLDRTFIDKDGTRWIIDYKTSRHEGPDVDAFLAQQVERYRGQLDSYASLMSELGDENIRCGLYFPILKRWIDWRYLR